MDQNHIQYEIQDNGYGMEEEQLEKLLDHLRQFDKEDQSERDVNHGIGLSNIYRRMKLVLRRRGRDDHRECITCGYDRYGHIPHSRLFGVNGGLNNMYTVLIVDDEPWVAYGIKQWSIGRAWVLP